MAQVRRPVPFRTRKLRPDTARVLHSIGCGRLARCRINLSSGELDCSPLFYYSHTTVICNPRDAGINLRQMFPCNAKTTTNAGEKLRRMFQNNVKTDNRDTRAVSILHQCPKKCFRALNRRAKAGRRANSRKVLRAYLVRYTKRHDYTNF